MNINPGPSNSNLENLAPAIIKKVTKELQELIIHPLEGIRVEVRESDVTDIQASIDGPDETPYAGGLFRLRLVLGKDFPQYPPKGYFMTKIFHPNVASNGEICVNTLKQDWTPTTGIGHILLVIRCLLIMPNPESALNEEAGKLLLERYDDYFSRAKMMTEIHAFRKPFDKPTAKKQSLLDIKNSQLDKKCIFKDKKKTLKRL